MDKSKFCRHCGGTGISNQNGTTFCAQCGMRINKKADIVQIDIEGNTAEEVSKAAKIALEDLNTPEKIEFNSNLEHFYFSNSATISNVDVQKVFINKRSDVHIEVIRQQEKTKRLFLLIAAGLLSLAIVVIVFTPPEKQTISYWVGACLLVLSAGAAGYRRLWAKSNIFEIKADQDEAKNSVD